MLRSLTLSIDRKYNIKMQSQCGYGNRSIRFSYWALHQSIQSTGKEFSVSDCSIVAPMDVISLYQMLIVVMTFTCNTHTSF